MNGLTLMAGAAVVGALATAKWQEARSAVTGVLRSVSGAREPETWDALVQQTRHDIDTARQAGDQVAEKRLADTWARRLQSALVTEPDLETGLRRVVFDVLLPMLPAGEQNKAIRLDVTAPRDQVISHNFLRSKDQVVR